MPFTKTIGSLPKFETNNKPSFNDNSLGLPLFEFVLKYNERKN
ncbi:MAG TPA: hypothetical protein VE244_15540 [Nitrososphaeraceae archaeon]|jgi:hypothetical protein|nr:hypothetical protein [Nitrososphaeraceae archaeon]